MKWVYVCAAVVAVFFLLIFGMDSQFMYEERVVRIVDTSGEERARFTVEIADTLVQQMRGLSGRDALAADRGMIFLYDASDARVFWMKDMRFPIDIVWVRDGVIVGVASDASVPADDDFLERYSSPVPVDAVLEVNAGMMQRYGILLGDRVLLE